jgi:hypothetical protein
MREKNFAFVSSVSFAGGATEKQILFSQVSYFKFNVYIIIFSVSVFAFSYKRNAEIAARQFQVAIENIFTDFAILRVSFFTRVI